nr:reverse transcriptase domain-containing protein [Tanacetum cinerariifolium]
MPSFKKELKACEAKTVTSSIDEPPEVELKDLPPHLEYAFLEGDNKLPVIIAKELGDEEKSALIMEDYNSKRDMLILEQVLSNDSLSLPENESFHFDIPSFSRPPAKPPDDDSGILTVKVVDDISELYVPMPRLLPTQPTLISNQEKSLYLLSHRGFKASQLHSKCPMMIYGGNTPILDVLFLHFYPP